MKDGTGLGKQHDGARDRRSTGTRTRAGLGLHVDATELCMALDQVREPLMIVDTSGRVEMCNRSFAQHTGLSNLELATGDVQAILSGATSQDWFVSAVPSLDGFQARVRFPTEGGESLTTVAVTPLRDAGGLTAHYSVTILNRVSGQGADEQDGKSALDTIGRLGAQFAHDVNNQLSVALNYTYILGRHLQDRPEMAEHLEEMRTAVWQASQMVSGLLKAGDRPEPDGSAVDVNELAQCLTPIMQHLLRNVTLTVDAAEKLRPTRVPLAIVEAILVGASFELSKLMPLGGECILSIDHIDFVPGEAASHLEAGPYVLLTAVGVEETAQEPGPLPQANDSGTGLGRAVTRAGGNMTWLHNERGEITLRVLLPAV